MKDIDGHPFEVGSKVAFARNVWRGKDIICAGVIKSVSKQFCQLWVTSKMPQDVVNNNIFRQDPSEIKDEAHERRNNYRRP